METAYLYLGLSGVLAVLLWTPYILSRAITWGIPTFLMVLELAELSPVGPWSMEVRCL